MIKLEKILEIKSFNKITPELTYNLLIDKWETKIKGNNRDDHRLYDLLFNSGYSLGSEKYDSLREWLESLSIEELKKLYKEAAKIN